MSDSTQRTISIPQLSRAVANHKLLASVTFLTVFGLVVAAWLFVPRKYGSEGRLFVQVGRGQLGLNTSTDSSRALSIQDTRETEIRSVAELVKSQDLLGAVVDEVDPDNILVNSWLSPVGLDGLKQRLLGSASPDVRDDQMAPDEYERLRRREMAIEQLSSDLEIVSEKKTSVISIYCTAATPRLARRIVELVMEKVPEKHVEIHSARRSMDFFDREFQRQQTELAGAEAALAAFRNQHGFLSIAQARGTLNGVVEKLENQRVDINVDLSQSLSRVAELAAQADSVNHQLEMPTKGLESTSTEGAQTQLYARIGEKARLRAKYKPGHPKLEEINAEIESLQKEIAALPQDRQVFAMVQNPVFEKLAVELALEESRAKSLERRLEQIEAEHAGAVTRLIELNQLELQAAKFQRDIDVAKQDFAIYATKRGEARVVDQLDRQAISDVVIAQPASLLLKPHSPKGSVMLPLGMMFALLASLLVALLADRKQLVGMSTAEQVEDAVDIPVLVSIPRVHSSRVRVN